MRVPMKVAIHQPQYLPWVPYLRKIEESDVFIFLDTVDFQKNGLQNRNQIKTAQGPRWLTVPVRQHLGQKIREVVVDEASGWRRKHWQTLSQCYGKAAEFGVYADELAAVYAEPWERLSDLNIAMTRMMMRWMGITTPIQLSSEMHASGAASELVLNLCREVGATEYLSGTGGRAYLDAAAFADAGIDLVFRSAVLPQAYPQQYPRAGFSGDLAALDLLLNCGAEWRNHLPREFAPE